MIINAIIKRTAFNDVGSMYGAAMCPKVNEAEINAANVSIARCANKAGLTVLDAFNLSIQYKTLGHKRFLDKPLHVKE